jgi:hypothetical protein
MSESTRSFTVESANATLPLVSRIVDDLMRLHPEWRQAVAAYELAQDAAPSDTESATARLARLEAGRLAGEIEACMEELEQVGCLFRGFELGLVDFPAHRDGEEVFLCWHHGETEVAHWHDRTAGFPGRQPIDAAFATREGA